MPLICTLGGTLIITDDYNDQLQIIMEQQAKFLSVVAPLNPDGATPRFKCETNLETASAYFSLPMSKHSFVGQEFINYSISHILMLEIPSHTPITCGCGPIIRDVVNLPPSKECPHKKVSLQK